jgi:hypothetical protein
MIQISIRKEEFEDTKGKFRICKSKKNRDNTKAERKRTKGQTMIYKILLFEIN